MGSIISDELVLLELGITSSFTAEELSLIRKCITRAEAAIVGHLRYDPVQKSHTEYFPQQDYTPSNAEAVWEVEGTSAVLRRRAAACVDELQLTHIPVRASTAIDLRIEYDGRFGTKSGSFAVDSKKVEGVDFWPQYDSVDSDGKSVCLDGIIRSIGRWPTEPGSVKVIYTAGYTTEELAGEDSILNAALITEVAVEESLRRAKKSLTIWRKNSRTGHNAGVITSESMGDYSYSLSTAVLDRLIGSGSLTSESKEKLQAFVNWGLYV